MPIKLSELEEKVPKRIKLSELEEQEEIEEPTLKRDGVTRGFQEFDPETEIPRDRETEEVESLIARASQTREEREQQEITLPEKPKINIPEPRTEKEKGAFNNFITSLQRGNVSSAIDTLGAQSALGFADWETEVKPLIEEARQLEIQDPVEGKNAFTNAFLNAVRITPGLGKGIAQGAIAAGATALVAPAAAPVVGSFGSMQYWARQGAGEVYNSLREEGVNHEVSSWVALIAGPIYASIEQSQVTKLLPKGITGGIKRAAGKSFAKKVMVFMAEKGLTTIEEIGQEGLQRIISDTAKEAGKWIDPEIKGSTIGEATKEILTGSIEEMKEAAKVFPFLLAPGASIDAVNTIRGRQGKSTFETPEGKEPEQGILGLTEEQEKALKEDPEKLLVKEGEEIGIKKDEERIPSEVEVREEPVSPEPIEEPSPKEAQPSRVLQEKEKEITKLSELEEEEKIDKKTGLPIKKVPEVEFDFGEKDKPVPEPKVEIEKKLTPEEIEDTNEQVRKWLIETSSKPGVRDAIDFFKKQDLKEEQIFEVIEKNRTVQEAINEGEITEDDAYKAIVTDAGLGKTDPAMVQVMGSNKQEFRDGVKKDVIKIWKGADVSTVIEEKTEAYYKRRQDVDNNWNNKITELRNQFEQKTGEKTKQSNIEWFSDKAVDHAVQGNIAQKIGRTILDIFNRFESYAKEIIKRAGRLRKFIRQGKVNEDLIKELDLAVFGDETIKPFVSKKLTTEPTSKKSLQVEKKETPFNRMAVEQIRSEIHTGEFQKRGIIKDERGDVLGNFAGYSLFPEYFKNKGYTKKNTLTIIDKHLAGKKLTEIQQEVFDDLYYSSGLEGFYDQAREKVIKAQNTLSQFSIKDLESITDEDLQHFISDLDLNNLITEEDFKNVITEVIGGIKKDTKTTEKLRVSETKLEDQKREGKQEKIDEIASSATSPLGETFQLRRVDKPSQRRIEELTQEIESIRGRLGIVQTVDHYVPAYLVTRAKLNLQLRKVKIEQVEEMRKAVLKYGKERGLDVKKGTGIASLILNIKSKSAFDKALDTIDRRAFKLEEKETRRKTVEKLKKTLKKAQREKFRPEFTTELNNLFTDIELSKPRSSTIRRLLSMKEFIETNPDHMIPEARLVELKRLTNIPVAEYSNEDLHILEAAISNIIHQNLLKNSLIMKGKYRSFDKFQAKAISNLDRYKGKLEYKVDEFSPFDMEKEGGFIKQIFTVKSWNAELISEIMDKEESGVIKELIYDGIDEGFTKMFRFRQDMQDYFKENFQKFGITDTELQDMSMAFRRKGAKKKTSVKTYKLQSGKKISLTAAQRISLYRHSVGKDNRRHVLEGGISFPDSPSKIITMTETDLEHIISDMSFKEFQVAGLVNAYFNVFQKDQINEISLRLNGWPIATVLDYFPIRTNALDRFIDELKQVKNTADIRNFMQITLEGLGVFKERKLGAKNAIILDDAFEVVAKSNQQISAFIGLAEPLRNAKMLAYDNDFQKKLINTYGKEYVSTIHNYLRDIEGADFGTEFTNKLVSKASSNITVAILGANPWVVLKQIPSYFLVATEMDSKYMANAKTADKELIMKFSPQLRHRFQGNISRDLGEINQESITRSFFGQDHSIKNSLFMGGISWGDFQAVGRIWSAVEKETKDLKPDLKVGTNAFNEHVAERTEEIVRKTQPTFLVKDRSEIGRSRQQWIKFLTKFSSARNKIYMVFRRAIEKYNRSPKKLKDKAILLKNLSVISIVSAGLIAALDLSRRSLLCREEPKKKKRRKKKVDFQKLAENKWFDLGLRIAGNNISTVYGVSNIFQSLQSGFDIQDPITQSFNQGVGTIRDMGKLTDQFINGERYKKSNKRWGIRRGEEKYKRTGMKVLSKSANLIATFAGFPLRNIRNIGKHIGCLHRKMKEIFSTR